MIIGIAAFAQVLTCFEKETQLISSQQRYTLTLVLTRAGNGTACASYAGQQFETKIIYPDRTYTTTATYSDVATTSIVFTLSNYHTADDLPVIYQELLQYAEANFLLTFNLQFMIPGSAQLIQHQIVDTQKCWSSILFSRSPTSMTLQVVPLNCEISADVDAYLEYSFDRKTYVAIPIRSNSLTATAFSLPYKHQTVKLFTAQALDSEAVKAQIDSFITQTQTYTDYAIRIHLVEKNQAQFAITQEFFGEATSFGSAEATACVPVKPSVKLYPEYADVSLDTKKAQACFTQDGVTFLEVTLLIRNGTNTYIPPLTNSYYINRLATYSGFKIDFPKQWDFKETDNYTFLLTLTTRYQSTAAVSKYFYYDGSAHLTCIKTMQTVMKPNELCLKFTFSDTDRCYGETGLSMVGKACFFKIIDLLNVRTWTTYLLANVNVSMTREEFSKPLELCFGDKNDTGEVKNERAPGTLQQRIKSYARLPLSSNGSQYSVFLGRRESAVVSKDNFVNELYFESLKWIILIATVGCLAIAIVITVMLKQN